MVSKSGGVQLDKKTEAARRSFSAELLALRLKFLEKAEFTKVAHTILPGTAMERAARERFFLSVDRDEFITDWEACVAKWFGSLLELGESASAQLEEEPTVWAQAIAKLAIRESLNGASQPVVKQLLQSLQRVVDRKTLSQPMATSVPQKDGTASESPKNDRRALVDAYIEEVFQKTGRRITRTTIWKSAGYKSRSEFERWERRDVRRQNKSADNNFRRILEDKPHLK